MSKECAYQTKISTSTLQRPPSPVPRMMHVYFSAGDCSLTKNAHKTPIILLHYLSPNVLQAQHPGRPHQSPPANLLRQHASAPLRGRWPHCEGSCPLAFAAPAPCSSPKPRDIAPARCRHNQRTRLVVNSEHKAQKFTSRHQRRTNIKEGEEWPH